MGDLDGRRAGGRRNVERRGKPGGIRAGLIARLRMQARTRAAANRTMRVQPSEPERMLEWEAADYLENDE